MDRLIGSTVRAKDMRLRDTVRMKLSAPTDQLNLNPYSSCVVVEIDEDWVYLERPYMTTADFVMMGTSHAGRRVIAYIGVERYRIELTSHVEYELLSEETPPK